MRDLSAVGKLAIEIFLLGWNGRSAFWSATKMSGSHRADNLVALEVYPISGPARE